MLDVTATVDRQDVARFTSAIQRLQTDLGKDAENAVQHAAIRFAMSGRARSKPSKKNRELFPNPNRTGRGKKAVGARYLIQYLRQPPNPPRLVPTDVRSDKRRVIETRGLAKASWGWMLSRMGRSVSAGVTQGRKTGRLASKFADVVNHSGRRDPSIRLTDRLTYLKRAFPGIEPRAFQSAANQLNAIMDKAVARRVAKANAA